MCQMVRYLLGATVVLIALLACLLAHKLRERTVVRQPTMRYACPTAAELLVSPAASDGDPGEVIELTALPLLKPLSEA